MPRPTLDELRQQLAATRNPAALLKMTAAQLAILAGDKPTAAAANALACCRNYPQTVLHVSASALRPDLLAAAEPPPPPAPPADLEALTDQ